MDTYGTSATRGARLSIMNGVVSTMIDCGLWGSVLQQHVSAVGEEHLEELQCFLYTRWC